VPRGGWIEIDETGLVGGGVTPYYEHQVQKINHHAKAGSQYSQHQGLGGREKTGPMSAVREIGTLLTGLLTFRAHRHYVSLFRKKKREPAPLMGLGSGSSSSAQRKAMNELMQSLGVDVHVGDHPEEQDEGEGETNANAAFLFYTFVGVLLWACFAVIFAGLLQSGILRKVALVFLLRMQGGDAGIIDDEEEENMLFGQHQHQRRNSRSGDGRGSKKRKTTHDHDYDSHIFNNSGQNGSRRKAGGRRLRAFISSLKRRSIKGMIKGYCIDFFRFLVVTVLWRKLLLGFWGLSVTVADFILFTFGYDSNGVPLEDEEELIGEGRVAKGNGDDSKELDGGDPKSNAAAHQKKVKRRPKDTKKVVSVGDKEQRLKLQQQQQQQQQKVKEQQLRLAKEREQQQRIVREKEQQEQLAREREQQQQIVEARKRKEQQERLVEAQKQEQRQQLAKEKETKAEKFKQQQQQKEQKEQQQARQQQQQQQRVQQQRAQQQRVQQQQREQRQPRQHQEHQTQAKHPTISAPQKMVAPIRPPKAPLAPPANQAPIAKQIPMQPYSRAVGGNSKKSLSDDNEDYDTHGPSALSSSPVQNVGGVELGGGNLHLRSSSRNIQNDNLQLTPPRIMGGENFVFGSSSPQSLLYSSGIHLDLNLNNTPNLGSTMIVNSDSNNADDVDDIYERSRLEHEQRIMQEMQEIEEAEEAERQFRMRERQKQHLLREREKQRQVEFARNISSIPTPSSPSISEISSNTAPSVSSFRLTSERLQQKEAAESILVERSMREEEERKKQAAISAAAAQQPQHFYNFGALHQQQRTEEHRFSFKDDSSERDSGSSKKQISGQMERQKFVFKGNQKGSLQEQEELERRKQAEEDQQLEREMQELLRGSQREEPNYSYEGNSQIHYPPQHPPQPEPIRQTRTDYYHPPGYSRRDYGRQEYHQRQQEEYHYHQEYPVQQHQQRIQQSANSARQTLPNKRGGQMTTPTFLGNLDNVADAVFGAATPVVTKQTSERDSIDAKSIGGSSKSSSRIIGINLNNADDVTNKSSETQEIVDNWEDIVGADEETEIVAAVDAAREMGTNNDEAEDVEALLATLNITQLSESARVKVVKRILNDGE